MFWDEKGVPGSPDVAIQLQIERIPAPAPVFLLGVFLESGSYKGIVIVALVPRLLWELSRLGLCESWLRSFVKSRASYVARETDTYAKWLLSSSSLLSVST